MKSEYYAFLMRFQRSKSGTPWRVTLENAHTGETIHFASEEQLLVYLFRSFSADHQLTLEPSFNSSQEDYYFEE